MRTDTMTMEADGPRHRRSRRSSGRRNAPGTLRISPHAWAKLLYLRDRGDTEVGGFGITAEGDPGYVEEFVTVKQEAHAVGVVFDDEAVADLFESQVDLGRTPERFARVWIHTHPSKSASPSGTDEETFERVFGQCDWAVMLIVGKTGETTARLHVRIGPGAQVDLPVVVDYGRPFAGSNPEAWEAEYVRNVTPVPGLFGTFAEEGIWWDTDDDLEGLNGLEIPFGWREALKAMDRDERALALQDLRAAADLERMEEAGHG